MRGHSPLLFLLPFFSALGILQAVPLPRWVDLGASGPEVAASQPSASRIQLTFAPAGFELRPVKIGGETWHQPLIPSGALLMEKGSPSLPILAGSAMLPDTGAVSLRVKASEYQDFPNTRIAPSKGPLPRSINPADVPYSFGPAYQQAQWPPQMAILDEPYILRDYRGVTVRVCPFRYFPSENLLRVYTRIVVELEISTGPGVNELSAPARARAPSVEFENLYATRFLNYSASPAARYTPLADQGELLIIGKDSLLSAVQPLADWKRQKGVRTTLVPLSTIGTTASQIKTYVQNYYNTNGLVFLLLVGDAADVPTLIASEGASDPSYSKLAGSDNYPDIFVGRFSGSATQQIATMVARTVRYEKTPDAAGTWYRLATGISSDEGESPSDIEHMNAIRTNLLKGYYTSVDQIYDPGASKTTLKNNINAGRGLINYVGHGDVTEWVTTGFNNTDVDALTNTTRWPFIFDVACVNGDFSGTTCFAEAWLRAGSGSQPAGALAIYASTINQDWSSPMTAQNEFNSLLLAASKKSYGGLCFNASVKMMDDWGAVGVEMFDTWTIFGDPSVQVRTLTPSNLAVTHSSTLNSLSYTVRVTSASGALAAISRTNQFLGSAWADGTGKAVISLASQPAGNVLLTVTAFNAIPYTSTVSVSSARLGVSPASFAESVEQGQSLECALVITNTGDAAATLSFTLSILPDYTQPRAATPLAADPRSIAGSAIRIVPTNYTAGSNLTLTVAITNATMDNEWIGELVLRFPAQISVTSASRIYGDSMDMTNDGSTGSGATVTWTGWDEDGYGAIVSEGTGTVSVAISPAASGPLAIGWTLNGDEYEAAPHTLTGLIVLAASGPPAASLTLTAPLGGETWQIGMAHAITWTSAHYTNTVNLDYSSNGGTAWNAIASGQPNSSSHTWTVNAPQSSNCRVRVRSANGAVASTSPAPFRVYQPLDWLSIDKSGGAVTGEQACVIALTFSAEGKATGDYHAILRVDSSAGSSNLPVRMTVTEVSTGTWTILASAGVNGGISPSGPVTVNNGSSTGFAIAAGAGYYIASVYTNGHSTPGAAGLYIFTSSWHNVCATGMVQAAFASVVSNTASHNTPVPWLRNYYTGAADLAELGAYADRDTDEDGFLGWQENIALTDPTDSASHFDANIAAPPSPGAGIVLRWWSGPGRAYNLYAATNLFTGMHRMASNLAAEATGMAAFTDRLDHTHFFYRIEVVK